MSGPRRPVRTSPPGRAARAARRNVRQDGGLAIKEPSGEGDARPPDLDRVSEQHGPRALTHGAFGAKQQKIARA